MCSIIGCKREKVKLLLEGQMVFPRVLCALPSSAKLSAQQKWNIHDRAIKPISKKCTGFLMFHFRSMSMTSPIRSTLIGANPPVQGSPGVGWGGRVKSVTWPTILPTQTSFYYRMTRCSVFLINHRYSNCTYLDENAEAVSLHPDQTASIGAVWSGSTLFATLPAVFRDIPG